MKNNQPTDTPIAKIKISTGVQSPISESMYDQSKYNITKTGDVFRIENVTGKLKMSFHIHVSKIDHWITKEDWKDIENR